MNGLNHVRTIGFPTGWEGGTIEMDSETGTGDHSGLASQFGEGAADVAPFPIGSNEVIGFVRRAIFEMDY